jgi:hypothetical protein
MNGWSGDDASSIGSAPVGTGGGPPRKRFYQNQKRTASPIDEDTEEEGPYHTRLPPMIDTNGYRDTNNGELQSPALASSSSVHFPDSQNLLSPTNYRSDLSDADEEAIAAARELGSLKIFGSMSFGYDEQPAKPKNRNRRGSSSSRNSNSQLPDWADETSYDSYEFENQGSQKTVNRSHYPPVSGRGSEGAFQTTQHMPKGQIRSVLVHGRFRDTKGKDVAHWKCACLRALARRRRT